MTDFTALKLINISDKIIFRKFVHFIDNEVYKIFLLALNFPREKPLSCRKIYFIYIIFLYRKQRRRLTLKTLFYKLI